MNVCPACGDSQTLPYKKYLISAIGFDQIFSLMACKACGLVYTYPQPTAEELDRIYSDEDYYAYQPLLIPPPSDLSHTAGWIKQWAKTAVMNHYYGYALAASKAQANPWLSLLGRLLKNMPHEDVVAMRRVVHYGGGGRHLDVGSGSGAYVWWMQKHGWQSEGLELNDKAVKNANQAGVNVKKAALLETCYPREYFDLVTAWGVMEHLPRIKDCFMEISRILKPGGRFVGFVPNISSWDAAIFKDQWQGLEIPSHLYHFKTSTIKRFLEEAGLKMTGVEFLPGLDSWKATLDKMGVLSGPKRKTWEAAGRLMYIVSNRVGRGAMFRFDSVKL